MRLISVNVGLPREVTYNGRIVRTGIFKQPVEGRVRLGKMNLEGDRQADLSVHGGVSKAVYVYPAEHYSFWQRELDDPRLTWGKFGENFTTAGLLEQEVQIGDRFRVGTAEVMVTEPRLPCYKLAVKFGREDMIKKFLRSGRTGFYLAVLQEGEVGAEDPIEFVGRDEGSLKIPELVEIYLHRKKDVTAMTQALATKALPEGWRKYFKEQIDKVSL